MLDTALPGPGLAGFADAVTGTEQGYAGVNDDELIGVLVAWQKTEAWAAAGRLSAVAELIRRRPVPRSGAPRGPGGPEDVIASDAFSDAGSPGAPSGPEDVIASAAFPRAGSPGAPSGRAGPRPDGGAGPARIPAGWGKFCADELAVALACSRRAAERMLPLAHDLAARLPGTARALREGVIDVYKAQIIAEATRVLDDAAAAAAEALVVPFLAGKTPGQIRAAIGRAVLKADPAAARERREQAQKDARVELWREDAGTAAICGCGLPPDEALAADQAISTRALDLKTAGVPGTMDQLRARAYLDALLGQDTRTTQRHPGPGHGEPAPRQPRTSSQTPDPSPATGHGRDSERSQPGGHGPATRHGPAGQSRPDTGHGRAEQAAGAAAKINLTIPLATLLGLADHPGEATGFGPLDASLARAMATAAAASPATTWCITVTDSHGHPTAHGCAAPRRHKKTRRNKDPDSPPASDRASPPGETSAASPAPTSPPGTTGPPGSRLTGNPNGPPGGYGTWRLRPVPGGPDLAIDLEPIPVTGCDHRHQTTAHDPSDQLRHLVQIRDRECTWPPCRRNAQRCDFEHAIPWEQGGKTCACNTGPRCRHHHHAKQAHGWHLAQHQPGYHTWTTPSGRTYTTGPTTYPI